MRAAAAAHGGAHVVSGLVRPTAELLRRLRADAPAAHAADPAAAAPAAAPAAANVAADAAVTAPDATPAAAPGQVEQWARATAEPGESREESAWLGCG